MGSKPMLDTAGPELGVARGSRCCESCRVGVEALPAGQRLLLCSRCKRACYCSVACQKADWHLHKRVCSSARDTPQTQPESSDVSRKDSAVPPTAVHEADAPRWGGASLPLETLSHRLLRVLQLPFERPRGERSCTETSAKAQELFRLGLALFFQQSWGACALAFAEGLLLDDKAFPEELAKVDMTKGVRSCPFCRIVEELQAYGDRVEAEMLSQHTLSRPEPLDLPALQLQLALLESHWLDMKLLFVREQCERASDPTTSEEQQLNWMQLLTELDAHARRAVARHGSSGDAGATRDRRILSRLTLLQAQYGANPPISRPPMECARLVRKAIELWPEDTVARAWGGRREDHEALLGSAAAPGLLEADARQFGKLCYSFAWQLAEDNEFALAREYFERGLRWEQLPGHAMALRALSSQACEWRDVLRRRLFLAGTA